MANCLKMYENVGSWYTEQQQYVEINASFVSV